jgi:hypothetical protein
VFGVGSVREGAGVFVALEGALRFKGETKGLWMPVGSTRRRFGAGGVDMVEFLVHICVVYFDVVEGEGGGSLELGSFGGVVTVWVGVSPCSSIDYDKT